MPNLLGKEVSDGSHNIIVAEATGSQLPNVIIESVSTGENVLYKIAGAGEIPAVYATIEGGGDSFYLLPNGLDTYLQPDGISNYLRP